MSIYSKVVSTILDTKSVHTAVEGTVKNVGAVYTFINGERKRLWPDRNPTSDPTVEYTTAGTHTVTLSPGLYKFTIKGAGGGGAGAVYNQSYSAAAGGGGAVSGTFELLLNVQETFTFVCGAGGNKATISGNRVYAQAGNGGITKLSSNLRGDIVSLTGGTGAYAYSANGNDHVNPSYSVGTAGSYTESIPAGMTKSFTAGTNGTGQIHAGQAYRSYGTGGTVNGGSAEAGIIPGQGSSSNAVAYNGGNGYLKIEPTVQYIYTSPTTTSITLDPGTYYFEIVGAGGGGLGVYGEGDYAYASGGSAASGSGYFTVNTTGIYNIQVGKGGNGNSSTGSSTGHSGSFTSTDGTASYIIRAADNFNVVTCGGGHGCTWVYNSHGEVSHTTPSKGIYSTSLSNNYTLADGVDGQYQCVGGDYEINLSNTSPVYFNSYGKGGYGRRLYVSGGSHEGGNGYNGMLKIYKMN